MPTTRSGARYGPGTPSSTSAAKQTLSGKRKAAAVKTYAKAKLPPSKMKATKVKGDIVKKKVAQSKKPQIKTKITKAQKTSQIQAAKRKELVDKRRVSGPRIQPDGGVDYTDGSESELIADHECKPGYIFIWQQVDPDRNYCPVDFYEIEVNDQDEMPPSITKRGSLAFVLKFMASTRCSVSCINEAKKAVFKALDGYHGRNREGWFNVSKEEWNSFIDLYNNAVNDYKA